jgi:fimbrial isopeptide formation D2 family protein
MRRLMEDSDLASPIHLKWWLLVVCLIGLWRLPAWAAGTAAGTTISNTATVSYTLGADPTPRTATASNQFEVLEIINGTLVWQDAANVSVGTPQNNRVLSFLLTNTGNGPESFQLIVDATVAGDQFDPGTPLLWIESNGTAGLQADDTPYDAAGITLPADGGALVYAVSTIPANLADGDIGTLRLSGAAMTPGAAGQPAGTLLPGAGVGSVDAVVGTSQAQAAANGSFQVATVAVTLSKSIARISDPFGGDRPYTGARVTYRIAVDLSGSGSAEALTITDAIPADLTFAPGSLVLDGSAQTDAADGDACDFNMTAAGTVTVNLNNTAAPAAHVIEFDATIN